MVRILRDRPHGPPKGLANWVRAKGNTFIRKNLRFGNLDSGAILIQVNALTLDAKISGLPLIY